MNRRVRALWAASRPSQLLLIAAVYALGVAVARGMEATVAPAETAVGLLVLLPVAVSVHYANEYADHETDRLTDRTPVSGGSGALEATGLPREFLLRAGAVALAAGVGAAAAGWLAGPLSPVALALLVGIAVLGWQYSVGPLSLSRRGLGELDNSLLGGLVLPLYGAAVVASPDTAVALAVLPFALVVFCNLLATQWPDRRADAAVGKDTLAVRLSAAGIRRLYLLVALLAAVSLLLLAGGAVPTTVALASLSAAPLLLWGAATFPGRPFPTVAAMVVLAVAQTAAWLWVG
ncbi:prenyltransferase [Halosegnis marinus]|uniref:Prenyltransferase n=1 Tax=Halosegnis marinus TaxID=3034023 RepID=A0ABD5ZQU7_9EURY|nr:prenyltransferase [Halosegnis sp. DT85]